MLQWGRGFICCSHNYRIFRGFALTRPIQLGYLNPGKTRNINHHHNNNDIKDRPDKVCFYIFFILSFFSSLDNSITAHSFFCTGEYQSHTFKGLYLVLLTNRTTTIRYTKADTKNRTISCPSLHANSVVNFSGIKAYSANF